MLRSGGLALSDRSILRPMLVSIDGKRSTPADAQVSVFDRGFLFGDAIYEVVCTHGGRLFQLEAHLDRLQDSGAAIGLDVEPWREPLKAEIQALLSQLTPPGERYVRIMLTRGQSPDFDLHGADDAPPLRVVMVKPLPAWPEQLFRVGMRLRAVRPEEIVSRIAPAVKSNNRQANVMAHRFAREAGADDALFVDPSGCVTEGPSWNLFGVTAGQVWTPPLVGGLLPGITRSTVLRLCADLGIPASERTMSLEDALRADELFITSTTRGVMPVSRLDEVKLVLPGPVTDRLRQEWSALAEAGER